MAFDSKSTVNLVVMPIFFSVMDAVQVQFDQYHHRGILYPPV